MAIFCQDTKLNLSPYYLKPGFSFGGSCLPKDVRALAYKAKSLDLDLPVLNAIIPSNDKQTARGIEMIIGRGKQPVSILGMSFKAGTDDIRESPILELIERLLGKGFDVRIFDRNVNLSKLVGANREYLLRMIPHVSSLLVDSLDDALAHGKIIVIGNDDPEFRSVATALRADQFIVDLVRIPNRDKVEGRYDGVAWYKARPKRILIVVENLSVPFDRRVWNEATTLLGAGYEVSIICPTGPGAEARHEILNGIHIFRHPLPIEARGALGYLLEYSIALFWEFILAWKVRRTRGFDAIHACNPPDLIFLVGGFFKLFFGTKFVFDHHDINPRIIRSEVQAAGLFVPHCPFS